MLDGDACTSSPMAVGKPLHARANRCSGPLSRSTVCIALAAGLFGPAADLQQQARRAVPPPFLLFSRQRVPRASSAVGQGTLCRQTNSRIKMRTSRNARIRAHTYEYVGGFVCLEQFTSLPRVPLA